MAKDFRLTLTIEDKQTAQDNIQLHRRGIRGYTIIAKET